MHYTIVQQLPFRVREILATVDYADTTILVQALEQLDKSREIENERFRNTHNREQISDTIKKQVNQISVDKANQMSDQYSEHNSNRHRWEGRYKKKRYQGRHKEPYDLNSNTQHLSLPDMRYPPPNVNIPQVQSSFNNHSSLN
ncbi:uncharacterized protein LOC107266476 [Cephus cinctus]|uniref:Uncharacterized protein LOC107266476 n=1 Tax=Cephus cinctus TaxID=211228 RepID=A0AAJ7BSG0_CEPCN|nr:uncharacterized protein LOC107266476 [Cephus cinctus]